MANVVRKPNRPARRARSEAGVVPREHSQASAPLEEQLDFKNLTEFRR
jgi:prevent-host-death family protein